MEKPCPDVVLSSAAIIVSEDIRMWLCLPIRAGPACRPSPCKKHLICPPWYLTYHPGNRKVTFSGNITGAREDLATMRSCRTVVFMNTVRSGVRDLQLIPNRSWKTAWLIKHRLMPLNGLIIIRVFFMMKSADVFWESRRIHGFWKNWQWPRQPSLSIGEICMPASVIWKQDTIITNTDYSRIGIRKKWHYAFSILTQSPISV